jgi:hypothetical protein
MGMLAPATMPAVNGNSVDAYTRLQLESVSTQQFVDILSNYLSRYAAAGLLDF